MLNGALYCLQQDLEAKHVVLSSCFDWLWTKHGNFEHLTLVFNHLVEARDTIGEMFWIEVGCFFFELPLEESSECCKAQQYLEMVVASKRFIYIDGIFLLETNM